MLNTGNLFEGLEYVLLFNQAKNRQVEAMVSFERMFGKKTGNTVLSVIEEKQ